MLFKKVIATFLWVVFSIQNACAYDFHLFLEDISRGQIPEFVSPESNVTDPSQPGMSLIVGGHIPNEGLLDARHFPYGFNVHTDVDRAAYALRTVAVLDFLHTRLALKGLIGDDRIGTFKSTNGERLNFLVPKATKDLLGYGLPSGIHPGVELIESLENKRYAYSSHKREQMVALLSFVTTELLKIDLKIKFLEEDIWKNAQFEKEVEKEVRQARIDAAYDMSDGGHGASLANSYVIRKDLKERYRIRYGIKEELENLVAQREIILDQYRLLAMDIDGRSFYDRLYGEMELLGFPSRNMEQRVPTNTFPTEKTEIFDPMAPLFDEATGDFYSNNETHSMEYPVNFASEVAGKISKINDLAFIRKIVAKVSGQLDKMFVSMLEANTKALETYSELISYESNPSLYQDLAQFPNLWQKAFDFYDSLGLKAEIARGQKVILETIATKKWRKETMHLIFLGAGLVLFSGSILLTWGAATPFVAGLGGGLAALMASIGGGLMTAAGAVAAVGSVYYYIDKSAVAEKLKLFYLSGRLVGGSSQELKNAIALESQAQQAMIVSIFLSGLPARAIFGLLPKFSSAAGKAYLQVKNVPIVLKTYEQAMKTLSSLGAVGGVFTRIARGIHEQVMLQTGLKEVAMVQRHLQAAERLTKLSRRDILLGLKKVPVLGKYMRGFYAQHLKNVKNNPYYVSYMLQDMRADLMIMAGADLYYRGPDDFIKEWPFVLTNTISTIGLIFGIHYYIAASMKTGMAIRSFGQVSQTLAPNFPRLFGVGAVGGFVGSAVSESLDALVGEGDSTFDERVQRTLYTTLLLAASIGISSNFRSTMVNGWVRPRIHRNVMIASGGNKALADASLARTSWGISFGNNLIGSGMFVYMAKNLGIQDTDYEWIQSFDQVQVTDEGELPMSLYLYDDRDPEAYLVPYLF